jgi:nucleoside 2-deoxyribosyltransferase
MKENSNLLETIPKPFVFVLMPFSEEFDDIYKMGIKPACRGAGAYCERVDEQIYEESMLERIYNQIGKADIIVADMTGRNPNVFYETGYAHALGKQVILLTQNAEDIPFDLKHYSHIVYKGKIAKLFEELECRIRRCLENPRQLLSRIDLDLKFFLEGEKLEENVEVQKSFQNLNDNSQIVFRLNVYNAGRSICEGSSFELGLILPKEFRRLSTESSAVTLPDNKYMHLVTNIGRILPKGWRGLDVNTYVFEMDKLKNGRLDCCLRIFTELGTRDIPFNLLT